MLLIESWRFLECKNEKGCFNNTIPGLVEVYAKERVTYESNLVKLKRLVTQHWSSRRKESDASPKEGKNIERTDMILRAQLFPQHVLFFPSS